ncbi:hypothetical protein QJS66_04450 [Kocuria rhizophila]|nr:hypothetical protein QJS66_04450 [Kocuria rhizophila]
MVSQPPQAARGRAREAGRAGQLLRRIATPAAASCWRAPEGFDAVELAVHDTVRRRARVRRRPGRVGPRFLRAEDARARDEEVQPWWQRPWPAGSRTPPRVPGPHGRRVPCTGASGRPGRGQGGTGTTSRGCCTSCTTSTHQGAELETARHFGITDAELVEQPADPVRVRAPGHLPDQLIDASWDDGHVYLGNAQELSEPVRLTVPRRAPCSWACRPCRRCRRRQPRGPLRHAEGRHGRGRPPLADALAARRRATPPRSRGTARSSPSCAGAIAEGRRVSTTSWPRATRSRSRSWTGADSLSRTVTSTLRGWCLQANGPRTFPGGPDRGCEGRGGGQAHPAWSPRCAERPARQAPPVQAVVVTDRRGRWMVERCHASATWRSPCRARPDPRARGRRSVRGGGRRVAAAARGEFPAGRGTARAPGGPRPLPELCGG